MAIAVQPRARLAGLAQRDRILKTVHARGSDKNHDERQRDHLSERPFYLYSSLVPENCGHPGRPRQNPVIGTCWLYALDDRLATASLSGSRPSPCSGFRRGLPPPVHFLFRWRWVVTLPFR